MASAALPGAGAPRSFERLAAEFSVRSVEALHAWAVWALRELEGEGGASPG